MRSTRLLPFLLLAVLAPAARAADTTAGPPADHAFVRIDGTVRTGCGAICDGDGNVTFGGSLTTVEGGAPVTYGFSSDITLAEGCEVGSAYGTLYFGTHAWAFAWTHSGELLVMTADDDAGAHFAGPGTHVFMPDPMVSQHDSTGCTSWASVKAGMVRL